MKKIILLIICLIFLAGSGCVSLKQSKTGLKKSPCALVSNFRI